MKKHYFIIQTYFFEYGDKNISFASRVFKEGVPSLKINEYFSPKTEKHYIEIYLPVDHSPRFSNFDSYFSFIAKTGLKGSVKAKDYFSLRNDDEKYALFFEQKNTKKK